MSNDHWVHPDPAVRALVEREVEKERAIIADQIIAELVCCEGEHEICRWAELASKIAREGSLNRYARGGYIESGEYISAFFPHECGPIVTVEEAKKFGRETLERLNKESRGKH